MVSTSGGRLIESLVLMGIAMPIVINVPQWVPLPAVWDTHAVSHSAKIEGVTFQISKGFPPDEEWPIAEVSEEVDGGLCTPAIVRIVGGERRLVIYNRTGGIAWDFRFESFVEALHQAEASLADYGS